MQFLFQKGAKGDKRRFNDQRRRRFGAEAVKALPKPEREARLSERRAEPRPGGYLGQSAERVTDAVGAGRDDDDDDDDDRG